MAIGVTNFPASLDDASTLIEVRDQAQTTLTSDISDSAATLPVVNTTSFPTTGVVTIAGEHIKYTGKTSNSFTGCTRGQFASEGGLAAAPHTSGNAVELLNISATHRVQNDAIVALETKVGTGADTPTLNDFLIGTGAGSSGWRPAVKGDVGLGNVDNTSDVNKPVSTAQQTALNLKANLASPTFTGTVGGITKSMVGLANVDNTSDADKPVSTAQAAAILGAMPPGCIQMYAAASPPAGWLLCNGSLISRTTYNALFAVIGTTYGAGDGSTTFAIPDMQSRMPLGLQSGQADNDTLGEIGGLREVTLTADQSGVPVHTHSGSPLTTSNPGNHTHTVDVTTVTSGAGPNVPSYRNGGTMNTGGAGGHTHTISGNVANNSAANASQAHTNMPPFITLNFIIKV